MADVDVTVATTVATEVAGPGDGADGPLPAERVALMN